MRFHSDQKLNKSLLEFHSAFFVRVLRSRERMIDNARIVQILGEANKLEEAHEHLLLETTEIVDAKKSPRTEKDSINEVKSYETVEAASFLRHPWLWIKRYLF